jgi:Fic family protein
MSPSYGQIDEPPLNDAASTFGWPTATKQITTWVADDDGFRHRARGTGELLVTIPPFIAELQLSVPSAVSATVAAAERRIAELDVAVSGTRSTTVEAAVFALLRSESVSSSRIEGLEVSHRRLAEAIYDPAHAKRLAREVAANVSALRRAIDIGVERQPITTTGIRELHRILMQPVPQITEGEFRKVQNWIGPSNVPFDAAYVPPPPDLVEPLMEDLVAFANRSDLPPVLQAAIAHAQFEAIHPFVDGNGRVGRCLISVILRRHGRADAIAPVSGVLVRDTAGYFADLQLFQQHANPWPWANRFASATVTACDTALDLIVDIQQLQRRWMEFAGNPRKDSVTARLIEALPTLSFTDADQVAEHLGVDPNVARRGLNALEAAGVLSQVAGSKRNRVWRADGLHQLLDNYGAGFTRDPI